MTCDLSGTCDLCGATHYGSAETCPYVELGIIPDWVEPERIQAMRLAIQRHYAKGKIRPDGSTPEFGFTEGGASQ